MDFITHALVGAGAARLISPRREWIPQLSLSAVLASEIQDADPWLYLIDPAYYGLYHRVATHNLWALAVLGTVSAGLSFLICIPPSWRRFGWFVAPGLPKESSPGRAPFKLLLLAAIPAAYLHLLGDVITGFGNILPFWPFSRYDASLHAVSSFDWVIFLATLVWHLVLRSGWLRGKKQELMLTGGYAALIALYVIGRLIFCSPTVW